MNFFKHRPGTRLSTLQTGVLRLVRRQLGWVVLSLFLTVGWAGFWQPVQAHRPHDVVTQVKLSPRYTQDTTVYTVVRGNVFKSVDGGNNWQRIVEGFDTLTRFST
ncbi:hypothetical protein IQ260_19955 [Leptolyngbya cf. ectocarpi LEGE 11479]|uniref:Photosynthesis system II assembly factor Ycf48/Hcf136-like domain-containing protein n=1 Tax=Leptolyngbya cf. ectocarpi LEGE 11479 TaxID=1828722 RepID=A0A928ZWU6_LEPEC|nr:hypothetical protein [Leptolyngbya ectocarpi]MBE9068922.1 hypothetical protein [Leptolyngbya cf. ectocarpi LEGE 11479]